MAIDKKTKEDLKAKVDDVALPLQYRKAAYKELWGHVMNPKDSKDFNPETFDPMDGVDSYEVKKRNRVVPNKRLPNMGMLPKDIHIGQMIGMFESKQDLYLLIAWLSNRVSDLEEVVESLTSKDNL